MHPSHSIHRGRRLDEPEALLGHEHPLARIEERMRRLRMQLVAVGVLLGGAGVALLGGLGDTRGLAMAAGLVLSGLGLRLLSTSASRRDRALDLIADGRDALPLEAVRRRRERLMDPRRARALARSLERIRSESRPGARRRTFGPPLYSPAVIRQLDGELARIVELLRSPAPGIVAIARAERLLSGERSPLYGEDPRRLGEELRRIGLIS
jgi:hypothetical protein